MFQNAYLEQSISFAEKIEQNIKTSAHRRSRGVKQAGFLVLRETTMPSVLVESGYLSNEIDNAYLATDRGQQQVANAIYQAFVEYKTEVERDNPVVTSTRKIPVTQSIPPQVPAPAKVESPKIIPGTSTSPNTISAKGLRPSLLIPAQKSQTKPESKVEKNPVLLSSLK